MSDELRQFLIEQFWIHPRYMLAGMMGAVAATLYDRESKPKELLRRGMLGIICANYFTIAFVKFGAPPETAAFVSGFGSMLILHQIAKRIRTTK
jgi:hypothetical protein